MPDQRDPNKVQLHFWIDPHLRDRLKAAAAEQGITVTAFLIRAVENELKRIAPKKRGK